MIVGALIHDLGDDLAPLNHSQLAAAIIRPYVRSEVAWMIEHHGVFQYVLLGDAMGVDKNAREIYRGHKWFDSCEKFCERWDQMSFDPDYTSYPLAHFEPMIREIFRGRLLTPALSEMSPKIMPKTFLITGANRGIGLEMTARPWREAIA